MGAIERLAHQPPETVLPLIECHQDINWPVAEAALPDTGALGRSGGAGRTVAS
ncbi:MAG: hypothetical protein PUD68_06900 [Clostridiales bacterium]|nr:hypothetical protein [Clostridiales bacterium]